MRPHGSAEELERRRRRAIGLLQAGHRQAEVARRVDAHPTSVKRWWEAYQKNGECGLTAKPAPGRPSKMTARQRKQLVTRLLKGANANGFSTALWTCPRIAQMIETRYEVHYHVDHIVRLMASLGSSAQKPEKRAAERDEERIARWVAKDWPRSSSPPPSEVRRPPLKSAMIFFRDRLEKLSLLRLHSVIERPPCHD